MSLVEKDQRDDASFDLEPALRDLDRREAAELARTWEVARDAAAPNPDHEAALERFVAAMESDPAPRRPDRSPSPRLARRKSVLGAAAIAAAALVAAVLLWPTAETVTTGFDEVAELTLPDGSNVVLNASSTLVYEAGLLADERRVELEGEAYFDVAEDEQAFRVETFNATATVVGTTFNVRADEYSRQPSTTVAVTSGVVELGAGPSVVVRLEAGEASEVVRDAPPTAPREVSVDAITAWQQGGFAMLDEPVYRILEALERRFGIEIALASDALADDMLSVHLPRADDAESVLADVCGALGCTYRARPGGFVVDDGTDAP